MKDHIKSTFGCVQENVKNEYVSNHLFAMPFRTKDNFLQDCLSRMQYLNIQDDAGGIVVRTKSTTLKEFNKESVVYNKDSMFNLMNCHQNNDDCVVYICMKW